MKYNLVDGWLAVIFGLMWPFDLSSGLSHLSICRNTTSDVEALHSWAGVAASAYDYYIFSVYSQTFFVRTLVRQVFLLLIYPGGELKGEIESMKKSLPDWQLRVNVYEINIAWCNPQNPAAVALEASCATHPNTSPSSFAFILEHISMHTHTHIPQSHGNIGAHRPSGVKLAVNQLQKPTLQNSMERKEFATKADKHASWHATWRRIYEAKMSKTWSISPTAQDKYDGLSSNTFLNLIYTVLKSFGDMPRA